MFKTDLFKGKRFLVTGGGTGLGKEMAEKYVELGADCVICGRRGRVLEETAQEGHGEHTPGRQVETHAFDIRVPDAVEEMIDADLGQRGPLDGLVNNAAGNFISRTEGPVAARLRRHRQHRLPRHVLRDAGLRQALDRREAARRTCISILTTWVWNGGPFTVPSAMSKAGLNVMTQSLAVEWAPPRHPPQRHRARPLPDRRRMGRASTR